MTRIVGPTGSKRRKRFLLLPLLCTAALALFWISGAQAVHDLTSNYFELGPGPTADEGGLTNILGYDSGGVSTGTEPNGYGPDWANLFNADGSKYTAGGDTTKADCEEYGTTNILDYGSTPSPGKECAFISDPSSAGSLLDNTTFSGFGTSNKNTDPISGPTTTTGTDCQVRGLTATQCTPWGWDFGNIPAKDDLTHTYAYEVVPQTGPRAGDVILYGGLERESPSGDSYVDFEFFQSPV